MDAARMTATAAAAAPSAFAPLRRRAFAALWGAALVSNTGTWMNEVGAAWLMTTLSPSPTMVAATQAATALPVFLFALPAGALADILDRRRLLLAVNLAMAAVAAVTAWAAWAGVLGAPWLLASTFLLGAGAAVAAPAWQATVPGLVPREELPSAVALNSLGVNVSRAVGPALAGVMIAALGLWTPFLANAASFLAVIAALALWRGEARPVSAAPPETLVPAMVAGLRFARRSPGLRRTIGRAVAFFAFASALWAMLPLMARGPLGGGPGLYGLLMGAVGGGAVAAALGLGPLRAQLGVDRLALAGGLASAAAMAGLALAPSGGPGAIPLALGAAALAGAGWIASLSGFQVSAQGSLPNWVRARGLALFLTAFYGAMAAGSLGWGLVAEAAGPTGALGAAAAGLALAALATRGLRLEAGGGADLAPSLHWPAPPPVPPEAAEAGPVLVTVDYRVTPAAEAAFRPLLSALRESRLRDGAYAWGAFRPVEEAGVVRETFLVASWAEHLRQHARVTEAERRLQAEIAALSGDRPVVRHHRPF